MEQALRIRPIAHGDLSDLTSLYRHLYPDYHIFAASLARDAFTQAIDEPGRTILVGFQGKELVSACTLIMIPNATSVGKPAALIENVVTHSDHRRKGFASKVLCCAVKLAWRVGSVKVLILGGFNEPAVIGLCAAAGFEQTMYGFELRHDAQPAPVETRRLRRA